MRPEEEVIQAALRRAAALAAGDEAVLRALMHPGLRWTTFHGEILGYEDYIAGNTRANLRWRSQRLADITVTVVGDAAVLTAAVTDYTPPQWPGQQVPQQMHLDVIVDDLDAAEAAVLELGATKPEHQPGTTFRVFLDPAGHPFCLCID